MKGSEEIPRRAVSLKHTPHPIYWDEDLQVYRRRCRVCQGDRTLTSFYRNAASRDGYSWECLDCLKAATHERRTQQTNAGGSYSAAQWVALKEQHNWRCLACRKQEPEVTLTADHVVPVAKGGSSDISNIQPLCKSCNSRKSVKVIDYRLQAVPA